MQTYFTSERINPDQKRRIFRFRTRMERFGENYRAGSTPATCPLCQLHYDNQEMSMTCPEIRKEVEVKGDMKDLFKDEK